MGGRHEQELYGKVRAAQAPPWQRDIRRVLVFEGEIARERACVPSVLYCTVQRPELVVSAAAAHLRGQPGDAGEEASSLGRRRAWLADM